MIGALVWIAAVAATTGAPEGARRLTTSTALQTSAARVWPAPQEANADRSRAYRDGCLVRVMADRRSPRCVYGRRRSRTTVVLYGDSHALQYFPALEPIARARRWRLVVLAKAGCPPGGAFSERPGADRVCRAWRRHALGRLRRERPRLVVMSGSVQYVARVGGRRLGRRASDRVLARGFAATARRMARGARVVFLREPPRPPFEVPPCVAASMDRLRRCAFSRAAALPSPAVIPRVVDAVPRVTVVDPVRQVCPGRLCHAVIGDALVWRFNAHLTATYAATMEPWLAQRLPDR